MGVAGNDELHVGNGNDRLYTGGGTDQLFGDAGNDTLIVDELFAGGTFSGGADTDTLELRAAAHNQINSVGPSSRILSDICDCEPASRTAGSPPTRTPKSLRS